MADLKRSFSCKCGPVQEPAVSVIVVDGVVQRASVVPDRQRSIIPTKSAGEFRTGAVLEQEPEEGPALGLGHSLKARRIDRIDVEGLVSALGMRAHNRVSHLAIGLGIAARDFDRTRAPNADGTVCAVRLAGVD